MDPALKAAFDRWFAAEDDFEAWQAFLALCQLLVIASPTFICPFANYPTTPTKDLQGGYVNGWYAAAQASSGGDGG